MLQASSQPLTSVDDGSSLLPVAAAESYYEVHKHDSEGILPGVSEVMEFDYQTSGLSLAVLFHDTSCDWQSLVLLMSYVAQSAVGATNQHWSLAKESIF